MENKYTKHQVDIYIFPNKLIKTYREEKETFERNDRNSYYKNELSKDLIEELDKFIHTKDIFELDTRKMASCSNSCIC